MQTDNEVFNNEVWAPIMEYEGWYEVSDWGRIRRVKRGRATNPGKVLKQYLSRRYLWVALYKGSSASVQTFRVARLVCTAFHGKKPSETHQVNHKDLNRLNNNASNLEWVTPSENIIHAIQSGAMQKPKPPHWTVAYAAKMEQIKQDPSKKQRGSMIGTAKLTEEQAKDIKRRSLAGESRLALAKEFGLNKNTISKIKYGKAWTHI